MSQMNPKEFVHNTAYWVQLPYIAGPFKHNVENLCMESHLKLRLQTFNIHIKPVL